MIVKLISSLEKCFLDEDIAVKQEYTKGSCLKNEIYRFGCCYTSKVLCDTRRTAILNIESPIKEYITVRKVESVGVQLPVCRANCDDNYLRKTPGLYPDLLVPVPADNRLLLTNVLKSLFIDVDTNGEVEAGIYPIKLVFNNADGGEELATAEFSLEIIDAQLPEQELKVTQWFHSDCLMSYYRTKAFDEEHWRILENFLRTAYKNGINMIMTPVFTLPLDTHIGGERPTTQLVGITLDENGYTFDFEKLGRWIDLCKEIGIKYFEMPHLFTQWGAKCTPKIVVNVDGKDEKLFGWHTPASSEKYKEFLNAFIPSLIEYLKSKGVDKQTVFHISDEPSKNTLENYKKAKAIVAPLLKDCVVMDALSDYDFYEQGIVEHPVPSNNHIEPFIENNVPDLWVYYCLAQGKEVSNRFIAMPSYRTRIMGMQMYKYDIKGFLQWGYNFYYDTLSYHLMNPYLTSDNDCLGPAGDTFSVYPAEDGTAYESLRILLFHDGIQDMRALKLVESLYGKEYAVNLLEEGIEPITFKDYPRSADYILNIREKINAAIKAKL